MSSHRTTKVLAPLIGSVALASMWAFGQTNQAANPSPSPSGSAKPSASPSTGGELPGTVSTPGQAAQQTVYSVTLNPLNSAVNGGAVTGTGSVVVDGDHFGISVSARGLSPGTHLFNLYSGPECPSASRNPDRNGIIDSVEVDQSAGNSVVKLNDLGSQTYLPTANPNGSSTFIQSAPLADVSTGTMNLDNAVVIVQGIAPTTNLPPTVKSNSSQSANDTLPVACGKLVRVQGPAQGSPSPSPSASTSASPSPSSSSSASPSPSPSASPS